MIQTKRIFSGAEWEATVAAPATSMIEVKNLIHPDLLIEIEADTITH